MLLAALARLSYQPSHELVAAATSAATLACWRQGAADAAPAHQQQQLAGLAEALAPPDAGAAVAAVRGRELAALLWALGRLRVRTPRPLLVQAKRAALWQLQSFSAHDVGLLLWGLAAQRHSPGYEWLRHVVAHFVGALDDAVGAAPALAQVVHALPLLPGGANLRRLLRRQLGPLLLALAAAAAQRLGECGPRELVALVQGFARLGFSPGPAWLAQHAARCGELGQGAFSDRERRSLHAAHTVLAELTAPGDAVGAAAAAAEEGEEAAVVCM